MSRRIIHETSSTLHINGSLALKFVTVAGPLSHTAGDEVVILANTTGGDVTVDLPDAATVAGRVYYVKWAAGGSNLLAVDAFSSQQIDGSLTVSLGALNDRIKIMSDGSDWFILE